MFDDHLDRQHRLSYVARGPEWAFVVPQGDLDALDDVLRRCSTFWNGAGSLILGIDAAGRWRQPRIDELMLTRPVDRVWLHPTLGDRPREAAFHRFPAAAAMWDGFDDDELHSLLLIDEPATTAVRSSMLVPRAPSPALSRVVLALWGHVDETDLPYWRARFELAEVGGEAFLPALLNGQLTDLPPASPLALGRAHMRLISQVSPMTWPFLCVLPERPGFTSLVGFWNFRSRAASDAVGMPVVGIPREALRQPAHLHALRRWVLSVQAGRLTPDLLVAADEGIAGNWMRPLPPWASTGTGAPS
jgi:hypothetical protein